MDIRERLESHADACRDALGWRMNPADLNPEPYPEIMRVSARDATVVCDGTEADFAIDRDRDTETGVLEVTAEISAVRVKDRAVWDEVYPGVEPTPELLRAIFEVMTDEVAEACEAYAADDCDGSDDWEPAWFGGGDDGY